MLFENLMFGNVSMTQPSLRVSGSEYSLRPWKTSLVQLVEAPE